MIKKLAWARAPPAPRADSDRIGRKISMARSICVEMRPGFWDSDDRTSIGRVLEVTARPRPTSAHPLNA